MLPAKVCSFLSCYFDGLESPCLTKPHLPLAVSLSHPSIPMHFLQLFLDFELVFLNFCPLRNYVEINTANLIVSRKAAAATTAAASTNEPEPTISAAAHEHHSPASHGTHVTHSTHAPHATHATHATHHRGAGMGIGNVRVGLEAVHRIQVRDVSCRENFHLLQLTRR